jgi:hypothetical protein
VECCPHSPKNPALGIAGAVSVVVVRSAGVALVELVAEFSVDRVVRTDDVLDVDASALVVSLTVLEWLRRVNPIAAITPSVVMTEAITAAGRLRDYLGCCAGLSPGACRIGAAGGDGDEETGAGLVIAACSDTGRWSRRSASARAKSAQRAKRSEGFLASPAASTGSKAAS